MKNNKTYAFGRILATVLAVVLTFSVVLCAGVGASAEEISAEAQNVLTLLEKLPSNPEAATLENKDDIVAAKVAFDALTVDQQLEIPVEKLTLLNQNMATLTPLLLGDLVSKVKELPKLSKITDKDKDDVVALYNAYTAMDNSAKEAFSADLKEQLLKAVNKVSPDTLKDEDKELLGTSEDEKKETDEKKEESKKKVDFQTVWQYVLIAFALLVVLCAFVAMVILLIKIVRMGR
ncbi:MAG: hypothetical protein IJW78_00270 [Clostridia bacterium]|nr:hypothetical protein [Clostridia bacterium]